MTSRHGVGPIVRTTAGRVRGRLWRNGFAYLAVPYAEPPYGALRFRAPTPRARWDGVRDAFEYGPTPQRRPMAEVTAIPEPSLPGADVLSLNVFTPDPAAVGLPVLVYIHGGGYVAGSPASPWYDGAAFTRDGVVVVTIAYRVAFEGFGQLPDAPANRGLLDQILALTWVRDNIAAFGGDPSRVTIAGQSAGGGAAMHLLVAPSAGGLFSGVIAISGSPGDRSLAQARAVTAGLAERLGVTPDLAGFAGVDELDLIAAQGIGDGFGGPPDADALLGVLAALAAGVRTSPTVDGDVLPWTVADGLARGEGAAVPLLVGATRDEFSGITAGARALFDGADAAALLERTGLDAQTAASCARSLPGRHPADVLGQSVTDRVFRRHVLEWSALRATAPAATFAYDFAWRSPVDGLAGHCLDVPFAWDVLGDEHVARIAGTDPPQALADAVHGAYVAFVRDGDPGWPRWDGGADGGGPVMTWDVESGLGDAAGYASAKILLEHLPSAK
jgi:para-nitrobenzyl esterase